MRIKRMPFEKNGFILSGNNGKIVPTDDQNELLEWLDAHSMQYNISSNILSIQNDLDVSLFILRWISN